MTAAAGGCVPNATQVTASKSSELRAEKLLLLAGVSGETGGGRGGRAGLGKARAHPREQKGPGGTVQRQNKGNVMEEGAEGKEGTQVKMPAFLPHVKQAAVGRQVWGCRPSLFRGQILPDSHYHIHPRSHYRRQSTPRDEFTKVYTPCYLLVMNN